MSDYSEDFEGSIKYNDTSDMSRKIQDKKDSQGSRKVEPNSSSSSVDNHQQQFEKNLKVLREEIKALEIEQMHNLETLDSGETLEIADDSSEDDMNYIKRRQTAVLKRLHLNPRSKSRQNPQKKSKDKTYVIQEKPVVVKNQSFHLKSHSRSSNKSQKAPRSFKSHDNVVFYLRPKQIVSAIPDLRYVKKKNFEPLQPLRMEQALESFTREKPERGPDWKKSVLESFVNSGLLEFNWERDPEIVSEEAILHVNGSIPVMNLRKTMKRLCKELFFENKIASSSLRVDIQRLLMARKTVICVLKDIHEREDLLLAILTLGKDAGSEFSTMHQKFMKLSRNILINIQKIKDSILGLNNFVYFGEDYAKKMQEDEKRISRIVGNIKYNI